MLFLFQFRRGGSLGSALARGPPHEVPPDGAQDEQDDEEGTEADAEDGDVGGCGAASMCAHNGGSSIVTRGVGRTDRGRDREAGLVCGEAARSTWDQDRRAR